MCMNIRRLNEIDNGNASAQPEALLLPVTFWVMPHSDFKMRPGDTFHIVFESDFEQLSTQMTPMFVFLFSFVYSFFSLVFYIP